jgi:NADPH-dependent 2,4-dienoyl-CoA reductase/sulfur reductase-like enzyme
MTGAEVRDVIAGFVTSAIHARSAGLDGVEVHGAQGHLIQEFVSPFSNQRTDEYGGSLENRLRFTRDTLRGIRDACGPDFIVGYRMGIEEFTPGGITVEESETAAAMLTADGLLDYVSLTQGNFNSIEMHAPDRRFPPVPFLDLHVRVREAARPLPVVTCTRVQTPDQAEEILANDAADLVGLCRALIVDPEWPLKAKQGRPQDIRQCIGCNQCWGWISEGNPIACVSNPVVGNEVALGELPRAAEPRKVLVVGGGPAGLEAARVAAMRGHHVTLLEQAETLGGRVREGADVPGQAEFGNILRFLIPQVETLGVCVRTGVQATLESVLSEAPDAVVVATGATPVEALLPGDGSVPAFSTSRIREVVSLAGERVVVMDEDGYYWASAALETLLAQGKRVSYVTRFFEPLRELPALSRITALRAFDERGVDFLPNTFVDRVENAEVVLKHYYSSREERIASVAAVIWVGPQRTNDGLKDELTAAGARDVHVVGDAFAPRRLADAIREGHLAGRAV